MFTATNGTFIKQATPVICLTNGVEVAPNKDLVRIVRVLYRHAERVEAIRFCRIQFNLSLKEAKDLCDAIHEVGMSHLDPYRLM